MTKNLLKETIEILNEHGHTLSDIEWVGGDDFEIPMVVFKIHANQEYDPGYGSQKVATDLKLVGKDFWLERREYDGSEWWEFKMLPTRPNDWRVVNRVMGGAWDTLAELNKK